MSKIYVIAGNAQQATDWIKSHIHKSIMSTTSNNEPIRQSDYCIVNGETNLFGVANPSGYFVGSWITRNDLDGIFMKLLSHTQTTTTKHKVLYRLYNEWMESRGRVVYR